MSLTVTWRFCRSRLLRDAVTTASTWSQPSGLNPEGKYVPQVSVTTCFPVTGDSEIFDQSQVKITSTKLLQRERQLNEKTVKPQARRETGEHQLPTVEPRDGGKKSRFAKRTGMSLALGAVDRNSTSLSLVFCARLSWLNRV